MRATKKGMSGILVLCLMLVGLLMPTQAMAASNSGVDGEIKWETTETQGLGMPQATLTLSAVEGTQGRMKEYSSTESVPWGNLYPTKIVINEGVTTITANAFKEFYGDAKIVFPKSIEKINMVASSFDNSVMPKIVYGYQGTCAEIFVSDLRKVRETETIFIPLDASTTPPATPITVTATPTSSKVCVEMLDAEWDFYQTGVGAGMYEGVESYNINGNNYFKLRDIAKMFAGSKWDFDITWDNEKQAINIVSDKTYTEVGGELAKGDGTAKIATESTASVFQDGLPLVLTAYTINGNNYVKLRDLAYYFNNLIVDWHADTDTIELYFGGRG